MARHRKSAIGATVVGNREFDSPLLQKSLDFLEMMEKVYLPRYGKKDRRLLTSKTENAMYDLIENVTHAQKEIRNRRVLQEKIDGDLQYLLALVRIACNKKYINPQAAAHVQKKIEELGKILGGWIKITQ